MLVSSPDEIVNQYRAGHHTQALALVVSWGRMGRTAQYIYGPSTPEVIEQIEQTLRACAESIGRLQSIAESWKMLTGHGKGELGWSSVMTSKALHFLCRSLGFEEDPPVAIDGEWIRNRAWTVFRNSMRMHMRPGDWNGSSFEAYSRYMTAILIWAAQKHWTTTQMEATIMQDFENPNPG